MRAFLLPPNGTNRGTMQPYYGANRDDRSRHEYFNWLISKYMEQGAAGVSHEVAIETPFPMIDGPLLAEAL